jgi:hypothetical protein
MADALSSPRPTPRWERVFNCVPPATIGLVMFMAFRISIRALVRLRECMGQTLWHVSTEVICEQFAPFSALRVGIRPFEILRVDQFLGQTS